MTSLWRILASCSLLCISCMSTPIPSPSSQSNSSPLDYRIYEERLDSPYVQNLEMQMAQSLVHGNVNDAVRLENIIESEVMGSFDPLADNLQNLEDNTAYKRSKRGGVSSDVVAGVIGASSGAVSGAASAKVKTSLGGQGSGSGSILNLVGPIVSSSSNSKSGAPAEGSGDESVESHSGGSDSGSILNLIGPIIGSSSNSGSSSGSGGGGDGEEGSSGGSGGSDSGSILNLIGPLSGSSSNSGSSSGSSVSKPFNDGLNKFGGTTKHEYLEKIGMVIHLKRIDHI
uniref:Uncharacterized protein n=1 Tax=Cacopsylla melanoneura TaxID=428564 RepID=A0A8D8LVL9_9HEMI